jgi:V-type H+-transporting ATPase subunit a
MFNNNNNNTRESGSGGANNNNNNQLSSPRPPPTSQSYLSSWFRSIDMEFISMVVQEDLAHACATELGRLGTVQLLDLCSKKTAFQRRYVHEVARIDVMERRLRYLFDMLKMYDVEPSPAPDYEIFLDELSKRLVTQSPAMLLTDLENLLSEREGDVRTLHGFDGQLTQELNSKIELKHVLEKVRAFAREDDPEIPQDAQAANNTPGDDMGMGGAFSLRFRFLAGTVDSKKRTEFERMIFRFTRGNSFTRFSDIDEPIMDPLKNVKTDRSVFVVFYQAAAIEKKLKQVCAAYEARTYAVPNIESAVEIENMIRETSNEIQERRLISKKNKGDMNRVLNDLAKFVNTWKLTLIKEKATYHAMNKMSPDVSGVLRAEGWVVSTGVDQVTDIISRVHKRTSTKTLPNWVTVVPAGQRGAAGAKPPTYFKTNKFTEAYQLIIDTYGVAKYKEVNPALFSAITFPFCFGVMFGDMGHGFWLFMFASFLLINEDKIAKMERDQLQDLLFGGRYVLILMAFFSIYCGMIYNDVMALGVALFNITWSAPDSHNNATTSGDVIYQRSSPPNVYPMGADPTWRIASNEIAFYNSFKMKFAVVFGVIHMMIGLFLKGANAIHFHKGKPGVNLDLWCEAIPQVLFLGALFGYMDFLIIYKWSIPWGNECGRTIGCTQQPCKYTCQPPSLITTLIGMVLSPGSVTDPMYEGQGTVQLLLVLFALCMVPIMLCIKPWVLIKRLNAEKLTHVHDDDPQAERSREIRAAAAAAAAPSASGGTTSAAPAAAGGGRGGGSNAGLIADAEHTSSTHDANAGLIGHAAPVDTGDHPLAGGDDEGTHAHGDEEHGVGDIIVHQAIETIEFVLGSISNTASYLRLWALSLAHSQLAAVFWERTLATFLVQGGAAGILGSWVVCAPFLAITFAVLMAMDNLECFLHALRLHWVEFMNKFFKAEGLPFEPLSFPTLFVEAMSTKNAA